MWSHTRWPAVAALMLVALAQLAVSTIVDNRRSSPTKWMFTEFGKNPKLLNPLKELVEKQHGNKLETPDKHLDDSFVCKGCDQAIGLVKNAIRFTLKYEDLRPVLLPVCKLLLRPGSKMCEGILDNYGHHVEHILRKTNNIFNGKNAEEICSIMNYCETIPEPLPTEAPTTVQPTTQPPAVDATTAEPTRKLDLTTEDEKTAEQTVALVTSTEATIKQTVQTDSKSRSMAHSSKKHPNAVMHDILTSEWLDEDSFKDGTRRKDHARRRRHANRKAESIRIVQLTDFHIDEKYVEGTHDECKVIVCCRNDSVGSGRAGHWGSYMCNVPPRTLKLFLKYVAAKLNPHYVFYTGDNPPHSAWEETYALQLASTKLVASMVTEYISEEKNVRVYPSMGNHDTMPTNLYSMDKKVHEENMIEFNQVWLDSWRKAANFTTEQDATIQKAGYYTSLMQDGLRLINVNSNYGYVDNFYNIIQMSDNVYKNMIKWLKAELEKAKQALEKVVILSHHDIGPNIIAWDEEFTGIMADYKDIIVFAPVGHTHRDEFRLYFGEDLTVPAGMMHVSMAMNGWNGVNPGIRLYYMDKDDYTILDYDQYYMNLQTADTASQPTKLYTFTEKYDLDDASAASHWELWQRLRRDRELMQDYWTMKRLGTGVDGECDSNCTISDLCTSVSQSRSSYLSCVHNYGDSVLKWPELPTEEPTEDSTISTSTVSSASQNGVTVVFMVLPILLNAFSSLLV